MDAAIDRRDPLPASMFALRNPEQLATFLRRHPGAATLAREAADRLPDYFPGDPIVLDVEIDPEDEQELMLFVACVRGSTRRRRWRRSTGSIGNGGCRRRARRDSPWSLP